MRKLTALLYSLSSVGLFGQCNFIQPDKKKDIEKTPNVLFILTDDQRFDAIGALGNEEIKTPNMDHLVHEGVTFTHAHVMGSLGGAVCLPSRTMIMTGKNLYHLKEDGEYIPESDRLLPEHFGRNGYETFATGKWHNPKKDFNRGFSHGENIFFGGMHSYESGGHFKPHLHHYDTTGAYKHSSGFKGDHFSSEYYADAAIDFIKKREEKAKPFFAYVAFTAPHDPRTPPKEFKEKYDSSKVSLPDNFKLIHPFDNGAMDIRDEVFLPIPRDSVAVKSELAAYYGMISEVDYQIGRIYNALKESGELDNTIIVFAGDNGLAMGQHGLLGKQNLYDHSMRVPLVISGPGIPKNKKQDSYCYLSDVYPTLCDMLGFEIPSSVESKSFYNAFSKDNFSARDHLFTAYSNVQRAIRKDEYKLIGYNVNGSHKFQLFNLKEDQLELNDLSTNPKYKDKFDELKQLLREEMKRQGDFCDLSKQGWGHSKVMSWTELKGLFPQE